MATIKRVSDHILSGGCVSIKRFHVSSVKGNQSLVPTAETDNLFLKKGMEFSPSFQTTIAHLVFLAATKGCLALSVDESTDSFTSARVEEIVMRHDGNLEVITQNAAFLGITEKPTAAKKLWWKLKRLYRATF
jgi:hypothetical protein